MIWVGSCFLGGAMEFKGAKTSFWGGEVNGGKGSFIGQLVKWRKDRWEGERDRYHLPRIRSGKEDGKE